MIGPNGAGKTTLLSILAGIVGPDEGEVHLPRGEVGWVPQQAALYRRLTVEENLRLFARLEGTPTSRRASSEMLEQTGLAERRDDQVARLSGGNQQRINIAIGLLAQTGGAAARRAQRRARPAPAGAALGVRRGACRSGTTVIFSTHNIQEAERYGERVLVIADGERLFDGGQSSCGSGRAEAPRRPAPTSRPRSSPSCTTGDTDALAAAQGSADPAPLAACRPRSSSSIRC